MALMSALAGSADVRRDYSIPMLDLTKADALFTTVERRKDYLGHPSTVLLRDGKTLLVAYPDGHGRGNLIIRRSTDAGSTWKPLAITPQRIEETPILYRLDLPGGRERILLVTCRPRESVMEWMWSDDRGDHWSERQSWKLEGTDGIIVALASLWPVPGEKPLWRGVFHDFSFDNHTVDLTLDAADGGAPACRFDKLRRIDYATPEGLASARRAGLCEAGLVVRPDAKRIALLFRPEKRLTNSMVAFSDDAGLTWTDPRELPGSLSGHRHESVNLPDGRTMVFMRDYSPLHPRNPSHGDWVAWVGTFDDLEKGNEGQYRIHLRRNYGSSTNNSIGDCGYSGVELLPDGTVLAITYGHWDLAPGSKHPTHPDGRGKPPYILQVKLDPRKTDTWVKDPAKRVIPLPAVALSAALTIAAHAALVPARPFADHMVLPMGNETRVWGVAAPGAEVAVRFGGHTVHGKADPHGNWRITLPKLGASAVGRELEIISGDERRILRDVLVGEVWLCSGQSNMDFPLAKAVGGKQEAADAGAFPAIRLMNLTGTHTDPRKYGEAELGRLSPELFFTGTWQVASETSALEFSAVGWWAGKTIHQAKGVPVGLIDNSVGGSGAEAWLPREVLEARKDYSGMLENGWRDSGRIGRWARERAKLNLGGKPGNHPYRPGFLFDSGLRWWRGFPLTGVLWYQGETNAEVLDDAWNERLITDLVLGWRKVLARPDLPFSMVQLPRIGGDDPLRRGWPRFRAVQARAAAKMNRVSLIETVDLGWDSADVHPPDKRPVGERLGKVAAR